ncbi:hypothetical protein [Arthrobacter pigmenti]
MAGKSFRSLIRRSTLGLRGRMRLGLEEDHVRVPLAAPKPDAVEHREQEDWK